MPVGRVKYMYLKPLSFIEFLKATKNDLLVDYIKNANLETRVPEPIHQQEARS